MQILQDFNVHHRSTRSGAILTFIICFFCYKDMIVCECFEGQIVQTVQMVLKILFIEQDPESILCTKYPESVAHLIRNKLVFLYLSFCISCRRKMSKEESGDVNERRPQPSQELSSLNPCQNASTHIAPVTEILRLYCEKYMKYEIHER